MRPWWWGSYPGPERPSVPLVLPNDMNVVDLHYRSSVSVQDAQQYQCTPFCFIQRERVHSSHVDLYSKPQTGGWETERPRNRGNPLGPGSYSTCTCTYVLYVCRSRSLFRNGSCPPETSVEEPNVINPFFLLPIRSRSASLKHRHQSQI